MKKKVTFITKDGNSFGDQILHYFVDGQVEIYSFPEGNWVDPEEYAEMLRGEDDVRTENGNGALVPE